MKLAIIVLSLVLAGCCTSDRCRAITTANMMHDAGDVAAESLKLGCTDRYRQSMSLAEIAELDKPCLPAAAAYGAFRRAHAALVAVLVALQAGDPGAAVAGALRAAQEAATELAARIAEVPR